MGKMALIAHNATFYNTQTQTSLFVGSPKHLPSDQPKVLQWTRCRMSKPPAREQLKIIAEDEAGLHLDGGVGGVVHHS